MKLRRNITAAGTLPTALLGARRNTGTPSISDNAGETSDPPRNFQTKSPPENNNVQKIIMYGIIGDLAPLNYPYILYIIYNL